MPERKSGLAAASARGIPRYRLGVRGAVQRRAPSAAWAFDALIAGMFAATESPLPPHLGRPPWSGRVPAVDAVNTNGRDSVMTAQHSFRRVTA